MVQSEFEYKKYLLIIKLFDMKLIKSIIAKIINSLKFFIVTSSNEQYCKYLRKHGVSISGGGIFRYPHHTTIDVSRPGLISIGENVDINDNFTIMTHDFGTFVFRNLYHDFVPSSGKVSIGNNVYIGRDVTILKGVSIGDNCIIGLGSIVTKDIPDNSVVCGVPAKVVCSIDEYYSKRKEKSIKECIDYYKALTKHLGRTPILTDFTEEWALFFRKEDFNIHPEMHSIIDWRIKDHEKDFWKNHKPYFNGFDDFSQYMELRQ